MNQTIYFAIFILLVGGIREGRTEKSSLTHQFSTKILATTTLQSVVWGWGLYVSIELMREVCERVMSGGASDGHVCMSVEFMWSEYLFRPLVEEGI